ncbi:PREDICTED: alpha-2-macroglobulin receptor-associated protein [Nicrophorus vespilloides]|uniref:Alpha-2-macroglobulin receptor-associated protein n=1 Tax=Nicrophorus vespilloides TaxID=110193 RepID=A0ABM1ML99_NICVS|nr:PREDICTED: alpha-2-macroglobulin receptor-associated protein [Nicrophorus vespilloides]
MKPLFFVVFAVLVFSANAVNKYSKEANVKKPEEISRLKDLDAPFRMKKINILWTKAKLRLTEPKLKSIYSELKIHDKEEFTLKRLKSEGGDKDGLKEAELRKKLLTIMDLYGLLEHFEDGRIRRKEHSSDTEGNDDYLNKSLFKDKKLIKLWSKAEAAGFTDSELAALKEEFDHHQDKVDQYYSLLANVKDGNTDDHHENSVDLKLEEFNTLGWQDNELPSKVYVDKAKLLREHNNHLKDSYDKLERKTAQGPESKDFVEPKVQGLWKAALGTDFSSAELESLRIELMHYENRLLKLRQMHAEAAIKDANHKNFGEENSDKPEDLVFLEDNIKTQKRKVEKMQLHIETKIMKKHFEL